MGKVRRNQHPETRGKEEKQQKKKGYKVVKVAWRDPEIVGSWHTQEEIDAPMELIYSIGYHIKETEDTLVLAGTMAPNWDGETKYGDVMKFPIGCVVEITEIELEE